ncbi:MAG: alpha/beta hydrolase [Gammaproteobacteria bacterium]|nr:alpha/beta hydrolase [Gammaproteobacteria bacterium]
MGHIKQKQAETASSAHTTDVSDSGTEELEGNLKLYKSAEGRVAVMDWYANAVESIEMEVDSKYVSTRFGRTHMLVAGPEDAPALILIPGVSGCAPLWRRQIPEFSKHFRVYALDIVGQPGKSDPITPSFLNDDFSLWMTDVLDALNLERAHFAGTSVGGWMVLRLGIFAPERINKIVMLSPTGMSSARLPVKIWITKYLNKRKDADALQDDLTAKSITNKSPGRSFGTFDRQLAKLMALCTRHYRVDRSLGIYDEKTQKVHFMSAIRVMKKFFLSEPKKLIRKFTPPALLVFGEHEMLYNPEKVAQRAKKLVPHIETDIIAGAGHAAIYDKPEEVNDRVIQYLLA